MTESTPSIPRGFRPFPFSYHEEIELEISTLTNMGKGLARTKDDWVIFVPFCLPGERVLARVYRNDKNFSEADLIKVITASPARVTPRCELFGQCGGCQYQNLSYPDQLKWKQQQLEELLRHMADTTFSVAPVIPSPNEYGYRSKITPHFDKPRNGKIGAIGFQRAGRRQLIDVNECAIAHPAINQQLAHLRSSIKETPGKFKKGATLLLRADSNTTVHTKPGSIAVDRVGSMEFHYPAGDFFQNNPAILEKFTSHVRQEAVARGATYMVDAYCGAGLFTLTAASLFEQVIGIEISEKSAYWARKNAEINSINNAQFIAGKVEDIFSDISLPGRKTAVVIDPPRKGCSENFLCQLFDYSPRTVIYVSCNPATQLRDLKMFHRAGYTLDKVQPFDLFPQTKHLECVMSLHSPLPTNDVP